jgi:hypothetical protein
MPQMVEVTVFLSFRLFQSAKLKDYDEVGIFVDLDTFGRLHKMKMACED